MDSQGASNWAGDPIRLPRVRGDSLPTLTGDRRPGARFCSGCGAGLEGAVVMRGFWTYCSIECAIRTEREDDPKPS
ncbi:MAG: hypothetical protein E6J29_02910 [Chloroflexi bacterium]|nr:MAG: hypothetical protein E6J29_02910 [Chloroflexota bacterium]TMD51961.1 MAG: hypothetical protein E6I85_11775 [Chloroflexota bacterium]